MGADTQPVPGGSGPTAPPRAAPYLGAVVLCGGTSRRMGVADKTALPFGEGTVLDAALEGLPPGPIVCVGDPRPLRLDGETLADATPVIRWAREQPPGGGPVAGLRAGLDAVGAHVETTYAPVTELQDPAPEPNGGRIEQGIVAVLAGDQPFAGRVAAHLVQALSEHLHAVEDDPPPELATDTTGATGGGGGGRGKRPSDSERNPHHPATGAHPTSPAKGARLRPQGASPTAPTTTRPAPQPRTTPDGIAAPNTSETGETEPALLLAAYRFGALDAAVGSDAAGRGVYRTLRRLDVQVADLPQLGGLDSSLLALDVDTPDDLEKARRIHDNRQG